MLTAVALAYLAAGPLGAAICGVLAFVIALVLWTPVRGWLGIPATKKRSLEASSGRVGYRGRPGSYSDLSKATFSEGLDTGIDNEGDVDAGEANFK